MKQVGIYMRVMTQEDGVSESLNRKLIAQLPVCRDDAKSGFILEIIDGRELPEYMTMNKGKICG